MTAATRPVDELWMTANARTGTVGHMETSGGKLDALDRKRIAGNAGCDDRTLAAYLDGKNVRPMVRARIERALREAGFEGAVRAEAAS